MQTFLTAYLLNEFRNISQVPGWLAKVPSLRKEPQHKFVNVEKAKRAASLHPIMALGACLPDRLISCALRMISPNMSV